MIPVRWSTKEHVELAGRLAMIAGETIEMSYRTGMYDFAGLLLFEYYARRLCRETAEADGWRW